MNKFWAWAKADSGGDELRIDGYIAQESWFGDEVTPAAFQAELAAHPGDLTVWINSGGGECFAAARIYNMLKEHKGKVTVKIDAIAASAASVIAMAGDEILMSPVSMMMIHNPATEIFGEVADLEKAIDELAEVKECLINAYQARTGLPRASISRLMDAETHMNAKAAVKRGFADGLLYGDMDALSEVIFDRHTPVVAVAAAFRKKLKPKEIKEPGTSITAAFERLNLLSGGKTS
jgi:ATP-dependent Clp protease protease subunit